MCINIPGSHHDHYSLDTAEREPELIRCENSDCGVYIEDVMAVQQCRTCSKMVCEGCHSEHDHNCENCAEKEAHILTAFWCSICKKPLNLGDIKNLRICGSCNAFLCSGCRPEGGNCEHCIEKAELVLRAIKSFIFFVLRREKNGV